MGIIAIIAQAESIMKALENLEPILQEIEKALPSTGASKVKVVENDLSKFLSIVERVESALQQISTKN